MWKKSYMVVNYTKKTLLFLLIGMLIFSLWGFNPGTAWAEQESWQQELTGAKVGQNKVTSFASDGTTVYAGVFGGGVFVRENDGTWSEMNDGLINLEVHTLTYDGATLYAGTQNAVFEFNSNTNTWSELGSNYPHFGFNVYSLLNVGSTLYAGTNNFGIWAYNNGSWTELTTYGLNGPTVWTLAYHNNALYAGTVDGVFAFINETTGWEKTNVGQNGPLTVQSLISVGSTLYAGTDGDFFGAYAYDGITWTPVNNGIDGARVYDFAYDGTTLYAGTIGEGVFSFDNTTSTWTAINPGLTNTNIHALISVDDRLFAGTDVDGVFSTKFTTETPVSDSGQDPDSNSDSNSRSDDNASDDNNAGNSPKTDDGQGKNLPGTLVAMFLAAIICMIALFLKNNI